MLTIAEGGTSRRQTAGQGVRMTGRRKAKPNGGSAAGADERLTARLAAAGAMLPQLYAAADILADTPTPQRLREAILDENALARPSLSARVKVYEKLQQRYFPPARPAEWPILIAALHRESHADQRALIAYVALCATEPMFRTLNLRWLVPRLDDLGREVEVGDVLHVLEVLEPEHREIKRWGEATRRSLAQHYLGALRDFGFARGIAKKRLARPHVGSEVVRYACELLLARCVAPPEVLRHEIIRATGLDLDATLDALEELDRSGVVRFRSQGGVVDLRFTGTEAQP